MKNFNTIFIGAVLLVVSANAEDPWTPSPLCPFPSEEQTRYPYEGDCTKYWECFEGARYPMNCPPGLEFNTTTRVCDHPTIANCNPDATVTYPTFPHSTLSTPSTVSTPDPGPLPECPFPSDILTFFPVINNCAQFWECFRGNRFLMNCRTGLFWNAELDTCDYPDRVNCNRSTKPSTNTVPSTQPTKPNGICVGQPTGAVLPHPRDCTKFYECVGGEAIEEKCPANLFWNDKIKSCDYPHNVNCINK